MIARITIIAVVGFGLASCDRGASTTRVATTHATTGVAVTIDDAAIIKVLAAQLRLREVEIKPSATLASLAMDDLDLVEVVMELEDQFQIQIPDERITAGGKPDEILRRLTVHDLGDIVRDCRIHPETRRSNAAGRGG